MSWAAIKKAINSNLSESLDKLLKRIVNTGATPLNTLISNVQTTANTVNSTVNTINTNTSRSAIKSVQRGVRTSTAQITISSVTPSKCTVNLFGAAYKSGDIAPGTWREASVYVSSLTSNELRVSTNVSASGNSGNTAEFSWEIVEFY